MSSPLPAARIERHPAPSPVAAARAVARLAAERAPALDHDGAFPTEDVAGLARAGLLAGPLPVAQGGAGLGSEPRGAAVLADVLRWIGWGSLPLGRLYEGHVNAIALVTRYGRPAQVARLAADARAGLLFGVWNTEDPASGLRLGSDGTGGLVLSGSKTFASGAGFVARPLVTARTEDGALLMAVPRLPPGERADLSAWQAHGMRASATGTVDFTGLPLTDEDVIGGNDDYHRQPFFSGGAWRFAAVQVGGIERLLDELRRHLRATGRGADPHQLARLGEAAIAAETARLWVERAALVAEAGEGSDDGRVAYVNLTRLAAERAGLDVLELAQRSIGLTGFLRTHPVERLSRDLATYLRQPAPDRALAGAAAFVLAAEVSAVELWPRPDRAP